MKSVAHSVVEGERAVTKLFFGQLLRERRVALGERSEGGRGVWQERAEMTHRRSREEVSPHEKRFSADPSSFCPPAIQPGALDG